MNKSDRILETYVAIRGRLTRMVTGMVPPRDVEDIVQETYVRVAQSNSNSIREPKSYFFRTARNLALDHIKRASTRTTTEVADFEDVAWDDFQKSHDSTFNQVVSDEEFVLFCEALRGLPKQCRRAFILKKVYGYSLKEIAKEMGVGQATVESHIVRGMKRCVKLLREMKA